jgi:hypothetical protein
MIKRYHGFADAKGMKKDKRQKLWKKQRDERGFDDTELWNLDVTMAKFILPRLAAFHKQSPVYGYNEIYIALKILAEDSPPIVLGKQDDVRKGLEILAKQWTWLWN